MRGNPTPATDPPAPPPSRPVADEPVGDTPGDAPDAGVKSPTTDSGLAVEDQVQKEWEPNRDGGLPVFLPGGNRR